jgi:preprotein translocase subunit SecG
MIEKLVLVFHLLVAGLIIGLVLLQRGKGAEAGTGFGAGASGTVFGSRGSASFFSRATAVLATLFFVTSLALAYFATQAPVQDSLFEGVQEEGAGAGLQVSPEDAGEVSPPDLEVPSGLEDPAIPE